MLVSPSSVDLSSEGAYTVTTWISSPIMHASLAWSLEVRKTSRFAVHGVAQSCLSVFLRRCHNEDNAATDAMTVKVMFSIRLLGVPGQVVSNSVVGKAAEAKLFSLSHGEEKWGWHRFMQWQEAVLAGSSPGTVQSPCEDMRFVVVMEVLGDSIVDAM